MKEYKLLIEDDVEDDFIELLESMTEMHADTCQICKIITVKRIP